jgi:uncharacterized protein YbaR (Trm112 family)
MMIDAELLDILVCPEDKTPVALAEQDLIDKLNAAIRAGQIENRGGESVAQVIDGGLVRKDGAYLYIIRDSIPVMLIDEAIPLRQLG